jgi:hypothetical protein
MALPMNSTPIYNLKVPSTGKELKFRPFLVRDEKALLIASESEDPTVMSNTIKEVITNCAKSPIDVDRLASFDVEYIFLKLRAKSVGEMVDLTFACDIDHGEDNEKARASVRLNLDDAKVNIPEGHSNKIPLFDDVGIMMKYPNIDTLTMLDQSDVSSDVDAMFEIVISCTDYIYDSNEMHSAADQSKEELMEFLNNLTATQFEKIHTFFTTMPTLRLDVSYTCPVCGREHNKYMEGLSNFF